MEQHFIKVIIEADGEEVMKETIELITDGKETFRQTTSNLVFDIVGVINNNCE